MKIEIDTDNEGKIIVDGESYTATRVPDFQKYLCPNCDLRSKCSGKDIMSEICDMLTFSCQYFKKDN